MKNFLKPEYYAKFIVSVDKLSCEQKAILIDELPKVLDIAKQRSKTKRTSFLCNAARTIGCIESRCFLTDVFGINPMHSASFHTIDIYNISYREDFVNLTIKYLNNIDTLKSY